jgi:lysyl-tRNA synthetase class 2
MLGLGFQKIYEIAKSYRNTEFSETHQPEFFMLEWYRAFVGLEDIEADICDLIQFLNLKMSKTQNVQPIQIVKKSMAELFLEKLNFKLTTTTSKKELEKLACDLGLINKERAESFSWDEIFLLIFIEKIEYQWNPEQIMIVHSYPASQAAYSRLNAEGWGERFELYWKGMELANAFHEVNDPDIQTQRFNEDLKKKKENGLTVVDLDSEFIEMLKTGMPPSGGIAMGLERLFMALMGLKNFSEWKLFLHKP